MEAHDAIRSVLGTAQFVLFAYLKDLSSADLMLRPTKNANHLAWQLGHLLVNEHRASEAMKPGVPPALPAGFAEAHGKDKVTSDNARDFWSKEEYLKLFSEQREATLSILESFSASELDNPGPEFMRAYAPTIGLALMMAGVHVLQHVGQIAVVRRTLNKPVVI
ncbi:MAG: DinB family protein [Bdellovibrionota bacterium]|nr:MAG: DinB family protein [Bdellovibrionota bacterium]